MSRPELSFRAESESLAVDLPTLLETRLLIQGSSGAGKTHLLFDLLQQLYGTIQQLVVDKEGQFARLREKYDYLLIGPDGELPIDFSKGAIELLLRKVLELEVNAIWDLSELVPQQQKEYVARLAAEAAHLPQRSGLWDQVRLFVVDEGQFFAPQGGSRKTDPALEPLIELLSLGRKRGFAPIVATQRVEKLNKDISDLLENRLIGRSGIKSAAEAAKLLDFDKHGRRELSALVTGAFYAYGPALALDPILVSSREDLRVRPRKRGEMVPPAPTPKGLRAVVDALSSFQREKDEHVHSIEELRATVAQQRHRIKQLESGKNLPQAKVTQTVDQKSIDKAVAAAVTQTERKFEVRINEISRERLAIERQMRAQLAGVQKRIDDSVRHFDRGMAVLRNGGASTETPAAQEQPSRPVPAPPAPRPPRGSNGNKVEPSGSLKGPHQKLINALATYASFGHGQVERDAAAAMAGYKPGSGHVNNTVGELTAGGYVEIPQPGFLQLTDAGRAIAHARDVESIDDVHEVWLELLNGPQQKFMRVLLEVYPDDIARDELAERAGYTPGSGHVNNTVGELTSLKAAVIPRKGFVAASKLLFPEGLV